MTISILLPYKENYSPKSAGAVSLFVKDTSTISKYKKEILIFGSTKNKEYLSKNYINIKHSKIFLKSSSKTYVNNFLLNENFKKTKILEVHNRPNYVSQIKKSYKNRLFLYFHNDPLSMNGSKTLGERKKLFENVNKLIFNSNWSRNRFFIGFKNIKILLNKSSVCYQSTNRVNINFTKKEKIITFIGKLNKAKGYDIFGKAIIKILDKHKEWKAFVIGDEQREKINFEHSNLFNLGFKDNNFILDFLKKTSISIVSSRWEEPFGRASLEAASRGAAVIISNKGGLPETSSAAIILKKLDVNNLYKEINKLISNKKKLLTLQKKNYLSFYLDHIYVTNIIDKIRDLTPSNTIIRTNKKILKIIHITNFNYRFDGRLQYNTGRRINNGLVRLGHNVLTISDRDILNQNKKVFDLTGVNHLQKKIINSLENFKPDLIILGHADSVSNKTINIIKEKNIKIAQWFLDPVSKFGPDYKNNKKRILEKSYIVDTTFLTTDPSSLDFKIKNSFFIPNPCDISFEVLKNFENNCENDLFFAMSHGVHRGYLKKGKYDFREDFINKLIKRNKNITFDIYGMSDLQPVWGSKFVEKISRSSMGLNLSRGKPIKYYSSDRFAQLIGNGLLTFIDSQTQYDDFFSEKQIVFYKNFEDLSEKINKYKIDYKERNSIARNGRKHYFKYFNSTLVAEFIINKTLDYKINKEIIWQK